jgi:hypothetical protein
MVLTHDESRGTDTILLVDFQKRSPEVDLAQHGEASK